MLIATVVAAMKIAERIFLLSSCQVFICDKWFQLRKKNRRQTTLEFKITRLNWFVYSWTRLGDAYSSISALDEMLYQQVLRMETVLAPLHLLQAKTVFRSNPPKSKLKVDASFSVERSFLNQIIKKQICEVKDNAQEHQIKVLLLLDNKQGWQHWTSF